ncbi:MAG: preprotein translocase subunit YajC [Clostridia bacterium]|nr:preprotein translocase subunit YajC [Clostridia bacterium]
MFNFLLEGNASGGLLYFVMIVFIIAMFFFMGRSQKKREREAQQEAQQMRDSLAVGDEVTTIGGIIGKVVSIKEETFVLETTKDKTKIRFLKGAIRSIDVKMADVAASVLETKAAEAAAQETPAEVEAPAESTEENK